MTKPTTKVINTQTGEEIEREMNDAEYAQHLKDTAEEQERKDAQAKVEADKAAAQAKLAALGLTADDLKALGL
jgi:transcription elongation GreA/GreB family factor